MTRFVVMVLLPHVFSNVMHVYRRQIAAESLTGDCMIQCIQMTD